MHMSSALTAINLKNDFLIENFKKSSQQQMALSRRYEQLLTTEKYCDCVFVVGEAAKVKCHKLILATASPVFEAMFYGPISEAESFVEILDMSEEIFQLI
ncbi:BTB/POZ and MATH domain-containing protein 3 [Lucilia cuprina]|nr:BTB/POZ and MATH domain-containing protein 3 [Lucilia cuprina]